jgi:hypothetical protein
MERRNSSKIRRATSFQDQDVMRRRTRRTLIGAAIAAVLGFADALYVKPYGADYVPQTMPTLISTYVFFVLPWAAIGALIGFLTSRKSTPRQSN